MHTLAVVSTIKKITPIEGKDRIVLANIENYNSVVAKDEFKEGDTAIYVFYDSILPQREEFEFLRKRCWSPKYNGFRIRPMKLGNVISEGLVLPMSMLPQDKNYKVGDIVTDDLGIIPYDPEYNPAKPKREPKGFMALMMKQAWFRKVMGMYYDYKKVHNNKEYPDWVVKSDEENIEKCYDSVINCTDDFIVTEKIEGCLKDDTEIITPTGVKTIKEIYDTQYNGDVLSFNTLQNKAEWKKCISSLKRRSYKEQWYKIETEEGDILFLTDIHPVFNPELNIYREAQNLSAGDAILLKD